MNTTTDTATAALARLNFLRRAKAKRGRDLTPADLLTLEQAQTITGKAALADWDASAVFVEVRTLVELYCTLTPSGRRALAQDEIIGGWFEEQDGDDADADGEFCSTPCHSDDVPSVCDFADALNHCARGGLLFVYTR
jgi:hypothetical protein